MRVLGMISGTSFDGIDVFVGDLTLHGDEVRVQRRAAGSAPYSDGLRERLLKALPPLPVTAEDVCIIDTLVGQEFAAAALATAQSVGGVDLIVSHGQTLYHWIDGEGRALGTLQVGNPAWIAERTGIPVVADLRSRDVAAGGQGAPLASLVDVLLLGGTGSRQAAVNLGGISNITVVADGMEPIAYDIGTANALLDAVIAEVSDGRTRFDADAAIASTGTVRADWLATLLDEPYYAQAAPKSTGKELFNLDYLERRLGPVRTLPLADLLATLTELTCRTVMDEVARWRLDRVLFAGGGTANPLMMQRMRELSPGAEVGTMDALGVDPREKEALLFALMGFLTVHGLPANVPSCTGATGQRILGSITPGARPLQLPAPQTAAVRRLRLGA